MGELGRMPRATGAAESNTASSAIAGPVAQMNRSARVGTLAAQGAMLNGHAAPVQFSGRGDGKKGNNKKQEKQKAATAGKKKAAARKEAKVINSFNAYQTGNKKVGNADVVKAVRDLKSKNVRLPGGHRSGKKSDGVNSGTIAGNKKILDAIKAGKSQSGNGDESDEEWIEDEQDSGVDYPDTDFDSDRKDFDRGGGGNDGFGGGGGGAPIPV